MQRLLLVLVIALAASPSAQRSVVLKPGMVIDRSIAIRPGVYRLAASGDSETPAIIVRGSNITIDFNGAVLAGSPDGGDPDTMAGVGILVDGGSHVTLKNAVVRGYKDPSWGYAKNRDTRSRGYAIANNAFRNVKTALQVRETADVRVVSNQFDEVATTMMLAGRTPNLVVDPPAVVSLAGDDRPQVRALPGGIDPMIKVQYYEAGGFAELRFDIQKSPHVAIRQ